MKIPSESFKKFILTISFFCLLFSVTSGQWQKLQAPDGYKLNDIFAFEDIICIRSSNLLFSSANSGNSWSPHFQSDAPFNSSYIYDMLLYDKVWYVCSNNGLYYSTDNGKKWQSYSILSNKTVICFYRNGNHLFAFTLYREMFHSSDNGNTWNFSSSEELNYSSSFVAESSRIFAFDKYVSANGKFLKRSVDYGITWISISDKLPGDELIKDLYLIDTRLYLLSQNNLIYRSDDYGDSWTLIFDNQESLNINSLIHYQNKLVLSTSKGIIYSDDGDMTWKFPAIENPYNVEYMKLICDSKNLFGSTSRYGIFKIDIQSDTAISCNSGLPNLVGKIQTLISHKNNLYRVVDNILLVSENNGIDWRSGEYTFPSLTLISYETFLLAHKDNILYISFDEGRKWDTISTSLTISSHTKIYSSGNKIWIDLGAAWGLYFSPDAGQTWQRFDPTQGVFQILNLAFVNNKLYLFSTDGLLFISEDYGKTAYYNNLPDENFLSGSIEYTTVKHGSNYLTFALDSKTHFYSVSRNMDGSWSNITIPTKKYLQLPIISAGSWLILTLSYYDDENGIYQCVLGSEDDGKNWVNISDGIQGGSLLMSNVIEQNGFLFARDYYGDIWSRPVSDLASPVKNKETVEFNVSPNPSTGLVTIPLDEVYRGTLEILSFDGRLEYSSSNAERFINQPIDLSFLKRGLHMVKITTKDKIYIGKLIHF